MLAKSSVPKGQNQSCSRFRRLRRSCYRLAPAPPVPLRLVRLPPTPGYVLFLALLTCACGTRRRALCVMAMCDCNTLLQSWYLPLISLACMCAPDHAASGLAVNARTRLACIVCAPGFPSYPSLLLVLGTCRDRNILFVLQGPAFLCVLLRVARGLRGCDNEARTRLCTENVLL